VGNWGGASVGHSLAVEKDNPIHPFIHPFGYKNPYPEKQIEGLPFSSFGIGGIFLHSSHHFIDDQKL